VHPHTKVMGTVMIKITSAAAVGMEVTVVALLVNPTSLLTAVIASVRIKTIMQETARVSV
jgi:hypothetical protein